jgi:chaperone required for assembly of F1-ATPase
MKTPYRHTLAVPSKALALMISNEFNRQDKIMKTIEMPILALSRTAVDADIEGHLA